MPSTRYHIIPDIHGMADKLMAVLGKLGWKRTASGWICDDPGAKIVFLGDYVDRGPDNKRVIEIVRSLQDAGKAVPIMGNHELNTLMLHYDGPEGPLRRHTEHNLGQSAAFLAEYPFGAPETAEVLSWMHSLRVCYETDWFKAIHACWFGPSVDAFVRESDGQRYLPEDLSLLTGELFDHAEIIMKGPECKPGGGFQFSDFGGAVRTKMRVKWWHPDPKGWNDVAASVPEGTKMPSADIPRDVLKYQYTQGKPLFYGHYWMTGEPTIENPLALCLDYSVAAGGPLLAYRFDADNKDLDLTNIVAA